MKRYAILITSFAIIGALAVVIGPDVEKESARFDIVASLDLPSINVYAPALDAEVSPLFVGIKIATIHQVTAFVTLSDGEPISSPKQARAPPRARPGLSPS